MLYTKHSTRIYYFLYSIPKYLDIQILNSHAPKSIHVVLAQGLSYGSYRVVTKHYSECSCQRDPLHNNQSPHTSIIYISIYLDLVSIYLVLVSTLSLLVTEPTVSTGASIQDSDCTSNGQWSGCQDVRSKASNEPSHRFHIPMLNRR